MLELYQTLMRSQRYYLKEIPLSLVHRFVNPIFSCYYIMYEN